MKGHRIALSWRSSSDCPLQKWFSPVLSMTDNKIIRFTIKLNKNRVPDDTTAVRVLTLDTKYGPPRFGRISSDESATSGPG